jgi:hypothetical protein
MAARFREEYGSRPLHLVACAATFALVGWALLQIFDGLHPVEVVVWIAAGSVAHDLVLFPIYALMGALAYRGLRVESGRRDRVAVLNHVRLPALLSGLLLLTWFPLLFGLSDPRFELSTGQSTGGYLSRWLLITGAAFALSAAAFALRVRRSRAHRR